MLKKVNYLSVLVGRQLKLVLLEELGALLFEHFSLFDLKPNLKHFKFRRTGPPADYRTPRNDYHVMNHQTSLLLASDNPEVM